MRVFPEQQRKIFATLLEVCCWPPTQFLRMVSGDGKQTMLCGHHEGENCMSAMRKAKPSASSPIRRECIVDFSEEVTREQVEKLDNLVKREFDAEEWVTVEAETW
jgi:hypothetical protein